MSLKLVIGTTLAAVLLASGAQAGNITNFENKPQIIEVISAGQEQKITLKPSVPFDLNKICTEECVIVLPNGEEYDVPKNNDLALEDGTLYSEPTEQGSNSSDQKSVQPQ